MLLQAVERMKELLSPVPSDEQSLSDNGSDADSAASGQCGQQEGDENKDRGNWAGRLDFVLSLVGSVCAMK